MLTLWLKQVDPPPTWSAMVTALKQPTTGLQKLAEEIEKQHIGIDSNGSSAKIAKFSFPHIKEVAPDDRTREELEQRLRVETEDIMQEFHILRHKLFDSLQDQKIAVDKLVEYLEEKITELLELKTFKDVKDFIKRNSSFYDYQLCLLYTSPSPRDATLSRMPSSA